MVVFILLSTTFGAEGPPFNMDCHVFTKKKYTKKTAFIHSELLKYYKLGNVVYHTCVGRSADRFV